MQNIENIVLIIIDQLRADYAKYLPKCCELLSYSAICDANSIPTSTEAMHANISTGKYPGEHGFISKATRERIDGLNEIVSKMTLHGISSLASLALAHSFNPYLIGGKPETVKVMGLEEECYLRAYYNRGSDSFCMDGIDVESFSTIKELLNRESFKKVPQERLDIAVLALASQIVTRKLTGKSLFVLTLPTLDNIGHEHGPNSTAVVQHLEILDKAILSFCNQFNKDSVIIVTGDHGCRTTTEYVIEADVKDPRQIAVYKLMEDFVIFNEKYYIDKEHNFKDVQYDGGIMRAWLKEGVTGISMRDSYFLSKYGKVFIGKIDISENFKLIYEQSHHTNLGDLIVVANPNTTFCKRKWLREDLLHEKISNQHPVCRNDLPIGEHGTWHQEDREVVLLSNYNFGRIRMYNVEIRNIINNILRNQDGGGPK